MPEPNFRIIYFYEYKLGHTAEVAAENINKVWGSGSIDVSTVKTWFNKFQNNQSNLDDFFKKT